MVHGIDVTFTYQPDNFNVDWWIDADPEVDSILA